MYKDYYGLTDEPFSITPDPRFLYLTAQHREALNHLLYGIHERKGFIVLTGEVGTGKTTLCRALLRQLDEHYHTALILNPVLTGTQLLRAIVEELGMDTKQQDRLGYLRLLNGRLLWINSAGQDVVLIIDEAQNMPVETLETTRLLSNLETDSQKLVQIVLVGQPELGQKLRRPELRQLAQRITVRYHLSPLTRRDTEQYIRHRLKVAAVPATSKSPRVCLDRGAFQEIYRYSRGTPRLINAIGDKALLAGYVYGTGTIDRRIVRIAAGELKEAC